MNLETTLLSHIEIGYNKFYLKKRYYFDFPYCILNLYELYLRKKYGGIVYGIKNKAA